MSITRRSRIAGRYAAVGATTLALAVAAVSAPAHAAPQEVTDATFSWTVNDESGGGAFAFGCNFLVAGAAGDTGSARPWTEADGFYATEVGNVTVTKPNAAGDQVQPTWATKCQNANGTAVGTGVGSTSGNQVNFTGGVGTVDPASNSAQIEWEGSFTFAFYGGMTYWTVSDPVLSVEDGVGVLSGIGGGFGADMFEPELWEPLDPTPITLATLIGVEVDEDGFVHLPEYLGVEVETGGGWGPQVRTGANWGAFPQDFVDFQILTGQSSYWYSSGGAVDPKKVVNPVTFGWTLEDEGEPSVPGEDEVEVDVEIPEVDGPGEPGEPGELTWSLSGNNVNLGTATVNGAGSFSASGSLPTVTVTDEREGDTSWTTSGQASDFAAASGSATIDASALSWTPTVAGDPAHVEVGTTGTLDASRLLAAGQGDSADPVVVDAVLDLLAPAGTAAGSYTSTITLTVVG